MLISVLRRFYGIPQSRVQPRSRSFFLLAKTSLAALASCVVFAPAFAQTALSLGEAQRIALAQSRQLPAQDLAAEAARHMGVAAGQLPDPVLKIGVDNLPINGPDRFRLTAESMTMRRIGVMQELTRGEKRRLRAERFDRDAELAMAEKSAAIASIERDTALAWLDRYYAEAMRAVVEQQTSQARLELAAAEGAYRGGNGSQADVFAARSAVAGFEDRASEFSRRVATARAMLERWVGAAADAPLSDTPAMDAIGLDPASLQAQLTRQPQIAVIGRQEAIAETDAKLAQANRTADWSVEVMLQQRGPAYSNMVSVGLSVPLQWDQRQRQDREVAAKRALLERTRAQGEDALRSQVAETRARIIEWQNGRERQECYRVELIPLAAERSSALLAAYRGGKARLGDVLGARRDELDVRLKALELEAEVARLWAGLRFIFPSNDRSAQFGNPSQEATR